MTYGRLTLKSKRGSRSLLRTRIFSSPEVHLQPMSTRIAWLFLAVWLHLKTLGLLIRYLFSIWALKLKRNLCVICANPASRLLLSRKLKFRRRRLSKVIQIFILDFQPCLRLLIRFKTLLLHWALYYTVLITFKCKNVRYLFFHRNCS